MSHCDLPASEISTSANRCFVQEAHDAPLTLRHITEAQKNDRQRLRVLACAASHWDLAPRAVPAYRESTWPRVPGGIIVGIDSTGRHCAGTTIEPCGVCVPCRAGAHLSCHARRRYGINLPGGFAETVDVALTWFCPEIPAECDPAEVAALIAMAGPVYQAIAQSGIVAGDSVLVYGHVGPGELPLQLLRVLGMRPVWITEAKAAELDALPSVRCHVLDLSPSPQSIAAWQPLVATALSCTLVGFPAWDVNQPVLLHQLLQGQVALRQASDLHPHLILDLVRLLVAKRLNVSSLVERLSWNTLSSRFSTMPSRTPTTAWPVFVPTID